MAGSFSEAFRFVSEEEASNNSTSVRQQLLRNGVDALGRTYGWGVGAGGSQAIQEQRGTVNGETSMHNFWFEVIVESGVYVGALFLTWYAVLLIRMVHVARTARDLLVRQTARSCALALTGFGLAAISASSTVYLLPMWLLIGLCIGVLNVAQVVTPSATAS
jgi:teichuronic acid biosynthesis protein TuaE